MLFRSGGSPLVGATTTDIVFALPDGKVEVVSHGALQYKKIPVDEVFATMDSVFASISF